MEAQPTAVFRNKCTCGGASSLSRPPSQPHMGWCPQREEYAAYRQANEIPADVSNADFLKAQSTVTPARLPVCAPCGVVTKCAQDPRTYGPGQHVNVDRTLLWCPCCHGMLIGRSRLFLILDWKKAEARHSNEVPSDVIPALLALGEEKGWRCR